MRLRNGSFVALLLLLPTVLRAAPPDPAALAAVIDRRVEAGWQRAGVEPARPADDAESLRRVTLDLTGRIPTPAEVRAYLADRSPDRYARLIERLFAAPGRVRHFTNVWRARWLPQADQPQFASLAPSFDAWLQQRLRAGASLDRLVRELLAGEAPAARGDGTPASPRAFLAAAGRQPEEWAGVTARLFLGLNVDCAQCHDHPFARWTRQQFWEFAALFTAPEQGPTGPRLALTIPGAERVAGARFLNGDEPRLQQPLAADGGRAVLAAWLTSPDNPYFARNEVNRTWAYFFGIGLVDPLDDLSGAVKPSHPELLDDLAKAFAASGFDHAYLVRAIVLSRPYRLASAGDEKTEERRLFRRMALRPLTGEQLYDSLLLATGLPHGPGRAEFLARFNRADPTAEGQRTVSQALLMMNGETITQATNSGSGRTLEAIATAPFLDTTGRVEALFLATLGRPPRDDERRVFVAHVESGGAKKDPKRALADVFWALLNSNEFGMNH